MTNDIEAHPSTTLPGPQKKHILLPRPEYYSAVDILTSDPDLWVFRRFARLHLMRVLRLQDRLIWLENQYKRHFDIPSATDLRDRDELAEEIEVALREYDAATSSLAQCQSHKTPSSFTLKQFTQIVETATKPVLLMGVEDKAGRDLALIAGTDKTLTHQFIDHSSLLRRLLVSKSSDGKYSSELLVYSEDGARVFEAVILHVGFCFLLLCPVIAMAYLGSQIWRIVILAIFLLIASIMSAGFLNSPNKSGLALVAGYAAILVVFLSGNVGS